MFKLLHCDDKTISEIEDELNYIPLTLLEKRILRDISMRVQQWQDRKGTFNNCRNT